MFISIRLMVSAARAVLATSSGDSVASWTGEAGDAAAARNQLAALLPVYDRVFGPVHPETLTARTGVATWTGEAGDATSCANSAAAPGAQARSPKPSTSFRPARSPDENAP
jgi:hypothetical protein